MSEYGKLIRVSTSNWEFLRGMGKAGESISDQITKLRKSLHGKTEIKLV